MEFYGVLWSFMEFYGVLWSFMEFYGVLWSFMITIYMVSKFFNAGYIRRSTKKNVMITNFFFKFTRPDIFFLQSMIYFEFNFL